MNEIVELRRRSSSSTNILKNLKVPTLLKKIYSQRGITNSSELDYRIENLLPYDSFTGIDHAVKLLINALFYQLNIMIVGDFDTDGATSTALLILALRKFGAKKLDFLIPNRFIDGYGLSTRVVEKAIRRGAQLIITVDNGISSHTGVSLAEQKNVSVLITDHHIPGKELPSASAIVNPNLPNCSFSSKFLAGVGVAFYLMVALRAKLIKKKWFKQRDLSSLNLAELLDLVAIGTVVDSVPLDLNNRILVYQGLNRIRSGFCRLGLQALIKISNLKIRNLCTSDLSFIIGPKINAAGRLENMSLGVMLFLNEDINQAYLIAKKLNRLNKIRKRIEENMQIEAIKLCKEKIKKDRNNSFGLVIYGEHWHQGVIGILASRMKEKFNRPVIVFAPDKNEELKGSGRSIEGFDIKNLLEHINESYPDLILDFGGHTMAVGIRLRKKKFKKFQEIFLEVLKKWSNFIPSRKIIWSDGELTNQELTIQTAEILRRSGPWGNGFPYPSFDGCFCILRQEVIKRKYLKLLLKSLTGEKIVVGIAFNIDLDIWPDKNIQIVRVVYQPNVCSFQNVSVLQILIEYIWPI